MKRSIYKLQIECSSLEQLTKVSSILNIEHNKFSENIWSLEIIENENDPYFDFINHFLNLLDNKYDLLNNIGVARTDISIWLLYTYDSQCNLEFLPKDLSRIGSEEISLSISCWASSSNVTIDNDN
jgi:hypothetical protein